MDDERVDKILQRGEMIFEFLGACAIILLILDCVF